MNSLRKLVARWQLTRLTSRMQDSLHSYPGDLQKPKHVLVLLPSTLRELTLIKSLLPAINTLFRPADISLLAVPGVRVVDMYPRKGYNVLTPSTDQLTWSGLPKKSYLETLRAYEYDTVLDLNLQQSSFGSAILASFPEAIRIGRGNHLGRPFYNLEIKTKYLRDERNIYRSMLEMLGIIMNKPLERVRTSFAQ
jgi:hypothetical protein